MANPTRDLTKDNHEARFGVNHLAHFLLFQRLKDTLLRSAMPEFPSRVVSVASVGHRSGQVTFDDLRAGKEGSYAPWKAYGQAKTANIYLANEIERRYGRQHLHAFSLHPGGILTGLQIHKDVEPLKDPKIFGNLKKCGARSCYKCVGCIGQESGGQRRSLSRRLPGIPTGGRRRRS